MVKQLQNLGLNGHLIGKAGSRDELATPALVLDLDLFETNIATMKAFCTEKGIAARPHAKTHKSADIAKVQIEAGALGVCCAKLSEAEALTREGITNLLLTSPIVTDAGMARLITLHQTSEGLMATLDNLGVALRLASAATQADVCLNVMIDLDVGLHRTGIKPGEDFHELADFIASSDVFEFFGVQAYAGHVQHIEKYEERREISLECMRVLEQACNELRQKGMAVRIVSGGGTGTYNIDPEQGILTELQVGSYIFMDRQYFDLSIENGTLPFEPALQVYTTVISANHKGFATTDAGFKTFASDADAPKILEGAPEGTSYFFFGDEQGGLALTDTDGSFEVGEVLHCIVPHCDPTVNLYQHYHCVRGDTLVDIWPVTARGCSQ